jgi:hypothetical protein
MSSWAQRLDENVYEADVRAEARSVAVRALSQYNSPLNRTITPAELEALRASDTSEGAGVAGDLPAREEDAEAS